MLPNMMQPFSRRSAIGGLLFSGAMGCWSETRAVQKASHDSIRVPIIDVHAHPSLTVFRDLVRDYGTLSSAQKFGYEPFFPPKLSEWTPSRAIDRMGMHNITAQVLSLPDITVGLKGEYAKAIARRVNESLAEIVGRYPQQFCALATLPHDDPDTTMHELAYALDVLKLDGVATTTSIRYDYLGESSMAPWLKELHRREAVLFVHPTLSRTTSTPAPTFIEFSFETARMIIRFILTGSRNRYEGIKLVATHGGGAIPFLHHRLELLEPTLGRSGLSQTDIALALRSFYYDLTSCMADAPLAALARFAEPERLLMGFDTPYATADMIEGEISRFDRFDGFTSAQKGDIAARNACLLFPRLTGA
jgi:6-methylsalicylate decarboxylase